MTQTDLWSHTTRLAPKPIDTQFYADLIAKAADWIPRSTQVLSDLRGLACEVRSGEVLQLQLLDGAQIVHLFMFNPEDPDERFWAQTSFATEGLFLSRYRRLWGIMARNRPMLTMLADTVTPPRRADWVYGSHHPICSGTGLPIHWRCAGGPTGILTPWEQMVALVETRGLDPRLILDKDDACFFQKMRIEPYSQHLELLPSDALTGDRVALFAEMDLVVLLALSPYVDGSPPPTRATEVAPRAVEVTLMNRVATPLPWPYPGVGYPDLSLYLDATGVRSDTPVPTAGRE